MVEANKQRGQPPISRTEPTVSVTLRVLVSQREKLRKLGGAKAVRAWLDADGKYEPRDAP